MAEPWSFRDGTLDQAIFNAVVRFNEYRLPERFAPTDIIIDVDGVYGTLTGGFNGAASTAKNLKEPQRAANLPVRGSSSPRMATTPS